MFSSLTQRLGDRMLDRLDLLVEIATLGGYGLDEEGVFALDQGAPEDGVRALALAGEGLVAQAGGSRAPAGQAWGGRPRGDCVQGDALTRLCPGGAARP